MESAPLSLLVSKCILFCSRIIAKMEELEEDGVYFILKSGLSSRISLNHAQNVHHGDDNDERSLESLI